MGPPEIADESVINRYGTSVCAKHGCRRASEFGMKDIVFHDPRFRVRRLALPELRRDPVVDRWVIVSTDRLGRTQELHAAPPAGRQDECAFCAGNEHLTPHETYTLGDTNGWRIRVVPNAFPALRPVGE